MMEALFVHCCATQDFLDFLSKLLVMDPSNRLNAHEALLHSWLTIPGLLSQSLPEDLGAAQMSASGTACAPSTALNMALSPSVASSAVHEGSPSAMLRSGETVPVRAPLSKELPDQLETNQTNSSANSTAQTIDEVGLSASTTKRSMLPAPSCVMPSQWLEAQTPPPLRRPVQDKELCCMTMDHHLRDLPRQALPDQGSTMQTLHSRRSNERLSATPSDRRQALCSDTVNSGRLSECAGPCCSAPDAHSADRRRQPTMEISERTEQQQQRAAKHERRGSFDGPSVPLQFREAAAAESSLSHEFRQKLMRLVANSRSTVIDAASTATSAQSFPQRNALGDDCAEMSVEDVIASATSICPTPSAPPPEDSTSGLALPRYVP